MPTGYFIPAALIIAIAPTVLGALMLTMGGWVLIPAALTILAGIATAWVVRRRQTVARLVVMALLCAVAVAYATQVVSLTISLALYSPEAARQPLWTLIGGIAALNAAGILYAPGEVILASMPLLIAGAAGSVAGWLAMRYRLPAEPVGNSDI